MIAVGSKVATGAEAEQSKESQAVSLEVVGRKVLSWHIGLGHEDTVKMEVLKSWESMNECI